MIRSSRHRLLLAALWVFSSGLAARPSRADERVVGDARMESARGVALGTGMRAAAASTQAQAENPANLPLAGLYHMEGFFGYQPQFRRIGVGASVVDSSTSRIAAGMSARGFFGDNDSGENSGWEGRLSLGIPIGDYFSLGVAGRYGNFTVSDPRAKPERPAENDETPDRTFKLKAFTLDASLTVRPIQGLAISALAYNLIDTDSPLAPMLLGGGLAFGSNGLSFGADALIDLNRAKVFSGPKAQIGGGVEFLAQGVAPLRAGYLFDQGRQQHFITGGIGYIDQRVGLQLSIRQAVAGVTETMVFAAVQYFIQQ